MLVKSIFFISSFSLLILDDLIWLLHILFYFSLSTCPESKKKNFFPLKIKKKNPLEQQSTSLPSITKQNRILSFDFTLSDESLVWKIQWYSRWDDQKTFKAMKEEKKKIWIERKFFSPLPRATKRHQKLTWALC
jgi:hypothetical protein